MNIEDIKRHILEIKEHIGSYQEPVMEYMKEHGADPAEGWVMYIPKAFYDDHPLLFPLPYLKPSPYIHIPVFCNEKHAGLNTLLPAHHETPLRCV